MLDGNSLVFDYFYIQSNSLSTETKADSPYTNPALRERIKNRVMAGSQGGRPGQWSARKAQLVAARYRAAGGGYKKGKKPTKAQRSLRKWTGEKWRTSDNKPALRGGRMRRYLPDKVWDRLTPAQRRATNAKKIRGDRAGRQFVANTEVAARRSRAVRMRSKALGKPIGGISEFDGDGDGFLTGPDGQDNIPAPAAAVARTVVDVAKPRMAVEPKRPRGSKLPPPQAGTQARGRGNKPPSGKLGLIAMGKEKHKPIMKRIMQNRALYDPNAPVGKRWKKIEFSQSRIYAIGRGPLSNLPERFKSRDKTNQELADEFGFVNTTQGLSSLESEVINALNNAELGTLRYLESGKLTQREITETYLAELLEKEQRLPKSSFPRVAALRAAFEFLGKEIPKTGKSRRNEDRPAFMDHKETKPPEIIKNEFDGINMMIAQPIEGLRGPNHGGGRKDFSEIRAMPPERRKAVSDAYMGGPVMDEEAAKYWDAAAEEIEQQFQFLTEQLGLKVEFTDEDPYPDFLTMREEVLKTGVLKILKTESTGGHPYWSNELNDKFRAVHDTFGHLATGRGFDRHGEEAAYQAHLPMFGPDAQRAIVVELRAQNSALIETGDFQEQKVMLFPEEFIKMLKVLGLLSKIMKANGDIAAAKKSSDKDNAFDKTNVHHASCGRRMKK